jgi:Cu-Zn family superoxide dismutase
VLAGLVLAAVLGAQAPAIETIPLPSDIAFPEGIAYDAARNAVYTASATTGAIVRVNLGTRAAETIVKTGILMPAGETSVFPGALGMKLDAQGRLWIAGGRTGRMFVIDTASGSLLRRLEVPNPAVSLINDVAVVTAGDRTTAYFTDTRAPMLWRVTATGGEVGMLQGWLGFAGTPLPFDPSVNNLNGIAVTPDGRELIVVHMARGQLFRIDIATKAVRPIDTGGADLTGADGLVLEGSTLYVVRQTAVEIARVELSPGRERGIVTTRLKDPALAWPATAVKAGNRLVVVNTQFNTRAANGHTLPFTLASVPLLRLSPGR